MLVLGLVATEAAPAESAPAAVESSDVAASDDLAFDGLKKKKKKTKVAEESLETAAEPGSYWVDSDLVTAQIYV